MEDLVKNNLQCIICADILKVPVMIITFNEHGHNCNSHHRLCLKCCRNYFQLNTSRKKRDNNKKCLWCNSCFVNPQLLDSSKTYIIDKLLMEQIDMYKNMLNLEDYLCECEQKFSTQEILYNHQKYECIECVINCPKHCGYMNKRKNIEHHLNNQCTKNIISCPICKNYNCLRKEINIFKIHYIQCKEELMTKIHEVDSLVSE